MYFLTKISFNTRNSRLSLCTRIYSAILCYNSLPYHTRLNVERVVHANTHQTPHKKIISARKFVETDFLDFFGMHYVRAVTALARGDVMTIRRTRWGTHVISWRQRKYEINVTVWELFCHVICICVLLYWSNNHFRFFIQWFMHVTSFTRANNLFASKQLNLWHVRKLLLKLRIRFDFFYKTDSK